MPDSSKCSLRAILWAWLVAGCLDISSAFVIWIWYKVPLTKGLKGIAAALIGREAAYKGGTETAALGLGLHFFIMLCVVLVFFIASRYLPVLTQRPVLGGIIYGPIVYLIMYWVVVQLSRIGPRPHSWGNDGLAIAIHICLIGLPIALIVSRFAPADGAAPTSPAAP